MQLLYILMKMDDFVNKVTNNEQVINQIEIEVDLNRAGKSTDLGILF